ncbi:MAG: nitroreductase family deazaflavin-dependent oxidoreductase [Actinomycetota bacterium]|nr:nitroreductase family deazaflavin-dependent oxidoreductase [Actinomycetota bacterium]
MSDDEYIPSTWDMAADHVERYMATDGDDGYEFRGAVCVVLTTRGRRTGAIRRSPLIRVRDGDRYLAVASMGGAPTHPSWYLNLVDDPEVTIQDRGEVHQMVARTADASEKAKLWPLAVAQWPEYDTYQGRTERDIPLVVCERRK